MNELNTEEFFQRNYKLRKEETLEQVVEYLNRQFPAIKTTYKNEVFQVSGEDKEQQLECVNLIKEILYL